MLGGFVVTNYHVVKGHEEFLLLCKDGQKIPAAIAAAIGDKTGTCRGKGIHYRLSASHPDGRGA